MDGQKDFCTIEFEQKDYVFLCNIVIGNGSELPPYYKLLIF